MERAKFIVIVSPTILLEEYENLGFLGSGIINDSISGVGKIFGKPYTSEDDAKKIFLTLVVLIQLKKFKVPWTFTSRVFSGIS